MDRKNQELGNKAQFLGIYFECCSTYGRIYKDRSEKTYQGMCPRCGKKIVVPIGEEGTSSRFFVAQ